MKFKTRFNLGRGENYMKWKVSYFDQVAYYDPKETYMLLSDCKLINYKKAAKSIYEGHNKYPCAWIKHTSCIRMEDEVAFEHLIDYTKELTYNPRVTPNWQLNGKNVDDQLFENIVTKGKRLYLTKTN